MLDSVGLLEKTDLSMNQENQVLPTNAEGATIDLSPRPAKTKRGV